MRSFYPIAFLALAGCSAPFGYQLDLRGGAEIDGGDDQIYFDAQRVEGLASGLNALLVPTGWREHPMHVLTEGVLALDRPLTFEWVGGKENLPDVRRERNRALAYPDEWTGEVPLVVFHVPATHGEQRLPFEELPPYDYDVVHEALARGGDAYVLVSDGWFLKNGFEVYGATGPPVMWVKLGSYEVRSGEGPLAFATTRTIGAVAYGLDLVGLGVVGVVSIVLFPFGGGWPPREFWMKSVEPAPW